MNSKEKKVVTKQKQSLCREMKQTLRIEDTREQDFGGTMSRPAWLLAIQNVVSLGKYVFISALYDSMLH